jgi:hypothetical protein
VQLKRYIKAIFQWLFVFPLLGGAGVGLAQTYPVHLTTQLVAPFSGYLPDYTNTGEEKLKILILFTDFSKPTYNIKLKISVQGQNINIQSKSFYFAGPFTVQPGVPLEISGSELYGLLNSQNLDFTGLTKTQYEQGKVLPEGFYTFCVTAYDYNNPIPIQVSNASCAQAWMVLSDPPFLNLPVCTSIITPTNPQQLTFAFTQMNMGSPNSAANTEYVFELWEIRPLGAIANNIVQTVPPIFSYTTNVTSINYGITEPPLLLGMQYAWRVTAVDITGRDLFKNQGRSQVCTFTYGNIFDGSNLNLNLHAQGVSQRQIKVWWDSLSVFTGYNLEFRKAGSGGNWYPVATSNSHVRILDLEPQTTYEFHVQGTSEEYTSSFSSNVNASTLPFPNYQCGEMPAPFNSAQFTPLTIANTTMIWQVGQFEMKIIELQNPVSSIGMYSGLGKITMAYGIKVNCRFTNVMVNSDQVLVQGKVEALTQGIDAWLNHSGVGTIQDGTSDPEVQVNSPLSTDSFKVNTNDGTVSVGGNTYTYTPSGETFEDSNGNIFIVTADGQVIQAGTQGTGHGAVPEAKNIINTSKGKVVFKANATQLYGLDEYKHTELINYYLTVKNVTDNTHPQVNWKSVMAQKYDVMDLDYQLNSGLKADSILFITGTGTIYKPQGSGNNRKLYIIGGQHGDVQELFACYKVKKDSFINIAKINIVSYRNEQNKITLVPLGNNISIDKATLQKQLNDIYKQSVATWSVDVAPAITAGDTLWDKDGNGKLNVGSSLFTRYSSETRAINKYIRAQTYYNAGEYYMVVTNKPTDSLSAGLQGEMPRGAHIGYVFTATPSATLIAHEIAHGAFALEHSFDGNATLPKNSSACLMDYNNGTELYKGKYWDYVHNPTTVIGILEDDEDAAKYEIDMQVLNWLDKIRLGCKKNSTVTIPKGNTNYSAINLTTSKTTYLAGTAFYPIHVAIYTSPIGSLQVNCKNKITVGTITKMDNHGQPTNQTAACLDIDGGLIKIEVPSNLLTNLKSYLEGIVKEKNLLLFVNGYRPTSPDYLIFHLGIENPESNHTVTKVDFNDCWKNIDDQFMTRIGTKNVLYADGHHSISTANHETVPKFSLSLASSQLANKLFSISTGGIQIPNPAYHNESLVYLNTEPNPRAGFIIRKTNGMRAGQDLLNKINDGTIQFDKSTDSVDIVAHSMGFAYAQGIIEVLKMANIKRGRYYILSPENGCSGNVNTGDFEEVWQYGSNLGETNADPLYLQDGVAPQCGVGGLPTNNRVFIPKQVSFTKDFVNCHILDNYGWIFNIKNVAGQNQGYVKPRK